MAVNNPHIQHKTHVLSIDLCHPEKLKFGYKGLNFWAPNRKVLGSTIKREIWSLGSQQERQPRTGSLVVGQSTYQLTPGIAVPTGCFSRILLAEFVRWQKSRNHSLNFHLWILLSIHGSRKRVSPAKKNDNFLVQYDRFTLPQIWIESHFMVCRMTNRGIHHQNSKSRSQQNMSPRELLAVFRLQQTWTCQWPWELLDGLVPCSRATCDFLWAYWGLN